MPDKADVVASSDLSSSSSSSSENANNVLPSRRTALTYYPAYCFKASPTWFTWVKLTAYDVHHHLRVQNGFQGAPSSLSSNLNRAAENGWKQESTTTLLLFYLNHPIQFIQLVGVLVTFEDYYEKFWLFTIDDSSGATIEVNCAKPIEDATTNTKEELVNDNNTTTQKTEPKDPDAESRCKTMQKLDIGVVVQVKGRISTFRNVRQLQLDRIVILHDTNDEMRLVTARVDFHHDVLTRAWEVSPEEQRRLQREAYGENGEEHEHDARLRRRRRRKLLQRQQQRLEREKRHTERIARRYEREERSRWEGADKARKAGQLLSTRQRH